jgi:hypothetical protein
LNATASDLWLYRDSNFENPGSMVTGLKYGTEANVGRTGLAVVAGVWPSASALVPTPPAGQSLQPLRISMSRSTVANRSPQTCFRAPKLTRLARRIPI